MNKTEARFAQVLDLRKLAGEILWFEFEMVTLKLATDTRFTPDFCALNAASEFEFYEVKGYMQDDAFVKIKVAAKLFPARFYLVYAKPKKDGGGWDIREVNAP